MERSWLFAFHKVDHDKNFSSSPLISLSPPFIPFKWDIYWLFTALCYTFTIVLVSNHKFPQKAYSCGPLCLLYSLLSLLPEVVYLLVCSSSPFQNPKVLELGLLSYAIPCVVGSRSGHLNGSPDHAHAGHMFYGLLYSTYNT